MTAVLVFFGILLVIGLWFASGYNRLVTLRNNVRNAWAQIDVQLKRRHDLIPNLVETVKGYMSHERGTLEAVVAARNQAVGGLQQAAQDPGNAEAIRKLGAAEGALSSTLGRLFALSENYPDLKASQNMLQLGEELRSTENKVAFARQAFNDSVTQYNIYRQTFPAVVFAGMFGHGQDAALLEFEGEPIQQVPKVSF
jgi:LemA protein